MTITKEAVLKALSYVEEPDLGQDLVTLNMIENIEIEGLTVAFTVVLTTPACPLKQLIHDACERAIHTMADSAGARKPMLISFTPYFSMG